MAAPQRPPLGETLHAPPYLARLDPRATVRRRTRRAGQMILFGSYTPKVLVIVFFHAEPRRFDFSGEGGFSCWRAGAGTSNNPAWRGQGGKMGDGKARPGRKTTSS